MSRSRISSFIQISFKVRYGNAMDYKIYSAGKNSVNVKTRYFCVVVDIELFPVAVL